MREEALAARATIDRMNADRLRRAAMNRAGGRARYVWRYSVLRLWLPMAVVATAVLAIWMPSWRAPLLGSVLPALVAWAVILLPLAVLVGLAWGRWMWRLFERHWFVHLDAVEEPSRPAT